MNNELMAIVQGHMGYVNDDYGKKIFKPIVIVYTNYSEKYLKKRLQEYRDEAKKNKSEWEGPKNYKLVKASKYPELLKAYQFNEWRNSLLEDIDFHFRNIGKEYLIALKSGIRHINFTGIPSEEVMCLGIKDITYTTSADESISARYRTSTWSFTVQGTLGKFPFNGSSYDVTGL